MDWLPIALQIAVGLFIVFIIYKIALWTVDQDRLVKNSKSTNPEVAVKIVDGFVDAAVAEGKAWNTTRPETRKYVELPRSFNRKGGAQFSYSLWLYLKDTSPAAVQGKVLLLRGDKTNYPVTVNTQKVDATGATKQLPRVDLPEDAVIKCPRIMFGRSYDEIIAEFNTIEDPFASTSTAPFSDAGYDSASRHNLLSLMPSKWVLLTFTFEDHVAIDDFEDGVIVRIFVNDVVYRTHTSKGTLRLNNGDFYLFPNGMIPGARIGDVTYYNYALGPDQVREVFERGPPTEACTDIDPLGTGDPVYLTEFNRLDIYNYGR